MEINIHRAKLIIEKETKRKIQRPKEKNIKPKPVKRLGDSYEF
jgi:hypothetical protein